MEGARVIALAAGDPAERAALDGAAAVLEDGGVIVVPTDSVYGIGCAATADNPGLAKVFELKGRDLAQTLPLVLGDPADLARFARGVRPWARRLAERFWPGALTLVLDASENVPEAYRAADGSVGFRVPDQPFVRALCRRIGAPVALTSANLHGKAPATSVAELEGTLARAVDLVVDGGPSPLGEASTVVDARGAEPRILRAGAIGERALVEALA